MKKRKKIYKTIQVILGTTILFLLGVGVTFSYYRTIDHIDNEFATSEYGSEISGVFTSPDGWKPGDVTPKTLTVKNNGDICENVRVSVSEEWKDKSGNILPNYVDGVALTNINFINSNDWVRDGNYFYYINNLNSNETTLPLIDSIAYKEYSINDFECIDFDNVSKCTFANKGYEGAKYKVTFNVETVECNAALETWGLAPSTLAPYAEFDTGTMFNIKVKSLTGTVPSAPDITDSVISSFLKADSSSYATVKSLCEDETPLSGYTCEVVSSESSAYPIYAFYNTSNLGTVYYYTEANEVYLNEDASNMFEAFGLLTDVTGLSTVKTSNTKNMSKMFKDDTSLVSLAFLSSWDTSKVEDITYLLDGDTHITSLSSLASWDVSSVEYMQFAFRNDSALQNLNGLDNWDVRNVKNMSATFLGEVLVTTLAPLANWQTDSNTTLGSTFRRMTALTNISALSSWNTSNLDSIHMVFYDSTSLANITPVSGWNLAKCKTMDHAFRNTAITTLAALSSWNTSNVTSMKRMFQGCSSLTTVTSINNWDVRKVTYTANTAEGNGFYYMFNGVTNKPTFSRRSGSWNSNGTYIPS